MEGMTMTVGPTVARLKKKQRLFGVVDFHNATLRNATATVGAETGGESGKKTKKAAEVESGSPEGRAAMVRPERRRMTEVEGWKTMVCIPVHWTKKESRPQVLIF
jgi:hypothetical protein